jgi:hypothetical protein
LQSAPGSTGVEFAFYSGGPLPVQRAYTLIFAPEDLFTGFLSDPTFIPGTFDAVYTPFAGSPSFPGTISIDPIETSTLAMMATGILGAITTLRSRKRKTAKSLASDWDCVVAHTERELLIPHMQEGALLWLSASGGPQLGGNADALLRAA